MNGNIHLSKFIGYLIVRIAQPCVRIGGKINKQIKIFVLE